MIPFFSGNRRRMTHASRVEMVLEMITASFIAELLSDAEYAVRHLVRDPGEFVVQPVTPEQYAAERAHEPLALVGVITAGELRFDVRYDQGRGERVLRRVA